VGTPNAKPSAKVPGVGQIVFASNRDGNLELYIAADTANAVAARLTNTAAVEMMPAWSPDYKKVASVTDRDGNLEIYSMKTTGGAAVRLTNHPAPDGDPVFSPDGSKIAFTSYRDGNAEIYVMDADGNNVKRLTVNGASDTDPTWSPDGTRIAFTSDRGVQPTWSQIWIMNAVDGSGAVQFSPPTAIERSPHYSPDGARIAFRAKAAGSDIVWREVNKTRTAAVTHTVFSGTNSLGEPNWSRDGSRVTFHMLLPGGQTYVVMDAFNASGILFQGATNGAANISPAWSR
jgi:TolB protein